MEQPSGIPPEGAPQHDLGNVFAAGDHLEGRMHESQFYPRVDFSDLLARNRVRYPGTGVKIPTQLFEILRLIRL